MLGVPFDEQFWNNDARYTQFSWRQKRFIKDDVLWRQKYSNLDDASDLQVNLHWQMLKVILQSEHGTACKDSGNAKLMQKFQQNYFFLSIASLWENWVHVFEICIKRKRMKNTQVTPEVFPNTGVGSWTKRSVASATNSELPASGDFSILYWPKTYLRKTHLPTQFPTPRQ